MNLSSFHSTRDRKWLKLKSMFRDGLFLISKTLYFKLYLEQKKTVLACYKSKALFCQCWHICHTMMSILSLFHHNFGLIFCYSQKLKIQKIILRSKIWPDSLTNSCRCLSWESPCPKICWWLPIAAGLTSVLSVVVVCMQILPQFEIIWLILVK